MSFPTPFVVHAYEGLYLIVKEVKKDEIIFFTEEKKVASRSKDNFIKSWSGYALLVNVTEKAIEKNYSSNLFRERIRKLRFPIFISIMAFLLYSFFKQNFNLYNILFKFFSIAGILVSTFLIVQLVNKNNVFIKRICHTKGNKKINCSSILNSKSAYFFGLISWSELGFIYFLSQLIIFSILRKTAINYLAILSLFSSLYIFYSIFYQWRIAKVWCKLCLFIQIILLFQTIWSILFIAKAGILSFKYTLYNIIALVVVPTIISIITSYILPLIKELNNNRKGLRLSNGIKMQRNIFYEQLDKSFSINEKAISDSLLVYGSEEPTDSILLVINPVCKPCIKTHKKLAEIISYNENILVKEIFLTDEMNSESYKLALRMVEIYLAETKLYFREAITDYYDNYTTKTEKWLLKHQKKEYDTSKASEILVVQTKWLFRNNITSTPHIICNDKILPEQYTIDDLEYILH